jgi:hypothetical protein
VTEGHEVSTSHVASTWLGVVTSIVAPTTLITAVCYYFGYVSIHEYLDYFGIDSNAIGFTTSDYIVQSIPPLFPVIIALLLAWVALTWVGVYARRLATAGRRGRLIRAMGWTAITVGVLGTVRGIAGVAYPNAVLTHFLWLTPAALGLGTVSMLAGFWMLATSKTGTAPRPLAAAEQASLVVAGVVIVLALFWLTDIFATTTGDNRAQTTAAQLWPNETGVVLDTSQRLNTPSNLIVESPLAAATPEGARPQGVTFRYQCFRKLVVRGDRWVLVPARWTPEYRYGYAVIVTVDSSKLISLIRLKDITNTKIGAFNWNTPWQCPEVAPGPQSQAMGSIRADIDAAVGPSNSLR